MRVKLKSTMLLLSIIFVLGVAGTQVSANEVVITNSEEQLIQNDMDVRNSTERCSSCYTYKYTYIKGSAKVYRNSFIAYHPHSSWTRFRETSLVTVPNKTGTFTPSFQVGAFGTSMSISYAQPNTIAGLFASTSRGKYYRFAVNGDKYTKDYTVKKTHNATGRATTYKETRVEVKEVATVLHYRK